MYLFCTDHIDYNRINNSKLVFDTIIEKYKTLNDLKQSEIINYDENINKIQKILDVCSSIINDIIPMKTISDNTFGSLFENIKQYHRIIDNLQKTQVDFDIINLKYNNLQNNMDKYIKNVLKLKNINLVHYQEVYQAYAAILEDIYKKLQNIKSYPAIIVSLEKNLQNQIIKLNDIQKVLENVSQMYKIKTHYLQYFKIIYKYIKKTSYVIDNMYYKGLLKINFTNSMISALSINDQLVNIEQTLKPISATTNFTSQQNQYFSYDSLNLKIYYINKQFNNINFSYFIILENNVIKFILSNDGSYIYINNDCLLEYNSYFALHKKIDTKSLKSIGYIPKLPTITITQQYALLEKCIYAVQNAKIIIRQFDLDNFSITIES